MEIARTLGRKRKHGFRFRVFLLVQRWIAFLRKAPRTFMEIELA